MENRYTRKRILYVDDDLQSRLLVKHVIGRVYDLFLCSTVEETLQLLKTETFDLILLDIRLEGEITGVELLAMIRKMPPHTETPALAVTAFAFDDDKKYILSSGFTDYITKPINLHDFKEKVRTYLENQSVDSY